MAPRATLTRIASGFIRPSSRAPMSPRVRTVRGRQITSTSAAPRTASRSSSVPERSTPSSARPGADALDEPPPPQDRPLLGPDLGAPPPGQDGLGLTEHPGSRRRLLARHELDAGALPQGLLDDQALFWRGGKGDPYDRRCVH